MSRIIYITGGARCGKTALAENLASFYEKVAVIEPPLPFGVDAPDAARPPRPQHWDVFRQAQELEKLVLQGGYQVFLLDSVTSLLENWFFEGEEAWTREDLRGLAEFAVQTVQKLMLSTIVVRRDLILVSGEPGIYLGEMGRANRFFIDTLGRVNRMIASEADEAYLMVSGLPVKLKG